MANKLTDADAQQAFRKKLGNDDFKIESWRPVSLMEDGRLGYLGDHFKLEAKIRVPASAPKAETVTLFIKGLPLNEQARDTVVGVGAFKKESLFYKHLADDITEAVGRWRGPDFQPAVFPQCRLITDECMVFDDLAPFGFVGLDARAEFPIEHARLVVRALGELHAGSLVLEERRGRTILEQIPELGFETFFHAGKGHRNETWHRASFKVCHEIVPHLDKYKGDPALVARIQAGLPALLRQVFDVMGAWPGVRNVINHGDVWTNNFMFRSDASGRPVEVSLVDFQLARYTPPASDLVFFAAFCLDRAQQEAHMDELTRLHWQAIADALRRAGLDPDKTLPWSEFEDVARKMWKHGLILMALEQPFSLAPSSVMDPLLVDPVKFHHHCHVDRSDTIIKLYHEDALFHRRYNETMERLIDSYILNP